MNRLAAGRAAALSPLVTQLVGSAVDVVVAGSQMLPRGGGRQQGGAAAAWAEARRVSGGSRDALAPSDDELEEFRGTVQTFAHDFVAPWASEVDRLNAYPPGESRRRVCVGVVREPTVPATTPPVARWFAACTRLRRHARLLDGCWRVGPPRCGPCARCLCTFCVCAKHAPRSTDAHRCRHHCARGAGRPWPWLSAPLYRNGGVEPRVRVGCARTQRGCSLESRRHTPSPHAWWWPCPLAVALSYGAHSNLCISQLVRHADALQLQRCARFAWEMHRGGPSTGMLAMPTCTTQVPAQAAVWRACGRSGHVRAGGGIRCASPRQSGPVTHSRLHCSMLCHRSAAPVSLCTQML